LTKRKIIKGSRGSSERGQLHNLELSGDSYFILLSSNVSDFGWETREKGSTRGNQLADALGVPRKASDFGSFGKLIGKETRGQVVRAPKGKLTTTTEKEQTLRSSQRTKMRLDRSLGEGKTWEDRLTLLGTLKRFSSSRAGERARLPPEGRHGGETRSLPKVAGKIQKFEKLTPPAV